MDMEERRPDPAQTGDVVYPDCQIHHVYGDEEEENQEMPCVVTLRGDYIIISYEEEEGRSSYKTRYWGKDRGHGHYELRADLRDAEGDRGEGRATLHRLTPESQILEGFWKETWNTDEGRSGAWQIFLGKPSSTTEELAGRCPKCNSSWVVPIEYGERPVDPDYHGQYVGGGCCVRDENWHCMSCDTEWP